LELEDQVESLPIDYGKALAIKWILKSAESLMKTKQRCINWFKKHDPQGDAEAAYEEAFELISHYTDGSQVDHGKDLFSTYVDMLRDRRKAKKKPKKEKAPKFGKYSWVEWDINDQTVSGFITVLYKGNVTIMLKDEESAAVVNPDATAPFPVTYKMSEWKESHNPRVTRVSTVLNCADK
jgi:hypothetical protein